MLVIVCHSVALGCLIYLIRESGTINIIVRNGYRRNKANTFDRCEQLYAIKNLLHHNLISKLVQSSRLLQYNAIPLEYL